MKAPDERDFQGAVRSIQSCHQWQRNGGNTSGSGEEGRCVHGDALGALSGTVDMLSAPARCPARASGL